MKMFAIEIALTGEQLCVAARNRDHAAQVFVTFWIARTGSAPGTFTVAAGLPEAFNGDMTAMIVAQGDAPGVLVRQTDGSTVFDAAIGR